jgi:ABC-2 type transport system permease protein
MSPSSLSSSWSSSSSSSTVAWLPLLARECASELRKAGRTPAFMVPTLVLPLAFYALFGLTLSRPGQGNAGYLLATYGVFGALGPSLFGFGAGLAAEREAGTLELKQVSPLPGWVYLGAKLATCLGFTLVVVIGLDALAAIGGGVALAREQWLALLAVHLASVLPFGLLGLAVGLSFAGSGAMAVTNVLFMGLAVVGGLWFPVFLMPAWLQAAAQVLPSYHLAELALAATGRATHDPPLAHLAPVVAFSLAAAAVAFSRWRRA